MTAHVTPPSHPDSEADQRRKKKAKPKRQVTLALARSPEAAWSMTSPFTRPRKRGGESTYRTTLTHTRRNILVDTQETYSEVGHRFLK